MSFFSSRGIAAVIMSFTGQRSRAFVLGGLGILGFYFLVRWIGAETPEDAALVGAPPLQVENLRSFIARKNGQKQWEFRADRVVLSPDGKFTVAQNVSRAVLFRDGRPFLTLRAPLVRLANTTNNLHASGGVSAHGPQGFSFQTQLAIWKYQQGRIEIPGLATARLQNLVLSAQKLGYNWKTGVLFSDKSLQIQTRGALLRAQGARVFIKTRRVELGGGVQLVFDPRERSWHDLLPVSKGALQNNRKPSNQTPHETSGAPRFTN